jgi:T3SS negative regulator,GrlR
VRNIHREVCGTEVGMVEGFWTVQFTDIQGLGFGVVTLLGGQVFGGDSGFMYTGTYTDSENAMNASGASHPQ